MRHRPGLRNSNVTGRLSGRAREILRTFSILVALCRFVSSSSRFRGRNVVVSPRSAVALSSRLLPTIDVRRAVCHMPLYRHLDTVGLRGFRGALIRRFCSILFHVKMSQSVIHFF